MEKFHIGIIGIFAGICTTVSFVPQILKIIKTRHVRDLSLVMYVVLAFGIFSWFVYGILIKEWPIIVTNIISFSLCLVVVIIKLLDIRRNK